MDVTLRSFSVVEEIDHAGHVYVRTEDDCFGVSWYTWEDYSVADYSNPVKNDEELEELYQASNQGYAHSFPTTN